MREHILLLKTLLLSTSQINIYRHSRDKKRRGKVIGSMIGMMILYLMIMAYCIATCIGYGYYGMTGSVPVMCALTISGLAFVFTFFKTNGYLFNFKEYDMLMSLPFEARTVASCKFLYMYIKSLPWYLSISVSMMIGYGIYAAPPVIVYPLWFVLSLLLPLIPMVLATFLGFVIARISAGFRKTNIVQVILTFAFVIGVFAARYGLEYMFRNDEVQQTLEKVSSATDAAAGIYLPAGWFVDAVTGLSVSSILLLTGVSILLFVLVFTIVGRSYRNINSALKSHAAARRFRMTAQKSRSVVRSVAFKEFKRLTGSTVYMVNYSLGQVFVTLFSIVTLIMGFDRIVDMVTQNAPFDHAILRPAIPFIIYFFLGMAATTACSPSLEGKNYWIVQSLPITRQTLYRGKMLFNMYMTVPFMVFATLCLCFSAGVPIPETLVYLLLGFALCSFSTAWGCVCGVSHMRLDWENDIEVVKQSAAVSIYLLPNMFVTMGMIVAAVFLGFAVDHILLAVIMTLVASVLALLSYMRVMALARRG